MPLTIVGLGPGDAGTCTPDVTASLAAATDLVGYGPYLDMASRVAPGSARRHDSDNREEAARARHALDLAAEGRDVVVVSSGDPGVFAMAAAVMEQLDGGPPVVLGRDIGRPGESVEVVSLGDLALAAVDMRTVVIVGSSTTRCVGRYVYTPRSYPG